MSVQPAAQAPRTVDGWINWDGPGAIDDARFTAAFQQQAASQADGVLLVDGFALLYHETVVSALDVLVFIDGDEVRFRYVTRCSVKLNP
jgi:uridine kinase